MDYKFSTTNIRSENIEQKPDTLTKIPFHFILIIILIIINNDLRFLLRLLLILLLSIQMHCIHTHLSFEVRSRWQIIIPFFFFIIITQTTTVENIGRSYIFTNLYLILQSGTSGITCY